MTTNAVTQRESTSEYIGLEEYDEAAATYRDERAREWEEYWSSGKLPECHLNEDGTPRLGFKLEGDDSERRPAFETLPATISGDTRLYEGVPEIYDITSNGYVTIQAADLNLRRVVIQPEGRIALELATEEDAAEFVEQFKADNPGGEERAEVIDYLEVYRRARAAGY